MSEHSIYNIHTPFISIAMPNMWRAMEMVIVYVRVYLPLNTTVFIRFESHVMLKCLHCVN